MLSLVDREDRVDIEHDPPAHADLPRALPSSPGGRARPPRLRARRLAGPVRRRIVARTRTASAGSTPSLQRDQVAAIAAEAVARQAGARLEEVAEDQLGEPPTVSCRGGDSRPGRGAGAPEHPARLLHRQFWRAVPRRELRDPGPGAPRRGRRTRLPRKAGRVAGRRRPGSRCRRRGARGTSRSG